jgi:predicted AAA+ superfamily ATPase
MKNNNPYAPKSLGHDYGSYMNIFHRYFETKGEYPLVYEICSVEMNSAPLEEAGFRLIFIQESENPRGEKFCTDACYEMNGVMIQFSRRESIMDRIHRLERLDEDDEDEEEQSSSYSCRILYESHEDLKKILDMIKRTPESKKSGRIYLMCSMDGMLGLQKFKTTLPSNKIDLESNYGSVASAKFDKIVSLMESDKNGLILFSGSPGTGKSTFIKMLSLKTDRKVIYLSSSAAEHLTSPDFLSFIMRHRDSILLLEDAEKVLRSREEQDNSAMSNLLNITDGILGDCLNVMVIATFNIDREMIDKALVRKGRLLVEHHFEPLSADMANSLLEKMGSDRRVSESTSLADIYNPEENFHEDEEIRKVGF